jgi:hypothetical protein
MKVNQRIKTKNKNRLGTILEVINNEDFENEIIVLLDNGKRMLFFPGELEVISV